MSNQWKMRRKPTLLVLAAGMGSRYGGLKQIDPVGPNGEIIIDYSIYDAISAGFGKVVFVIRRDFEEAFKAKIGRRIEQNIETAYVYQELGSCLSGFQLPESRQKPWGTGHAILVAADIIDEPFAVINADDYYGRESLRILREHLSSANCQDKPNDYAMVGYKLSNTLSKHGAVSRGICRVSDAGCLETVSECTNIQHKSGKLTGIDETGEIVELNGNETASMNLWGFTPSIFKYLSEQFQQFLQTRADDTKAEFFIPTVVDRLIHQQIATVRVLATDDSWFGVTYRQDREFAENSIKRLITEGIYPESLR